MASGPINEAFGEAHVGPVLRLKGGPARVRLSGCKCFVRERAGGHVAAARRVHRKKTLEKGRFIRMRKLVLAFAALTAVSVGLVGLAVAATPGPDYLDVASWKAAAKSNGTARLSATTKAAIPTASRRRSFARTLSSGIAWVDSQTSKVFVVTIHPVLGRDSHQNPRGWHAHTAQLAGGAIAPNDLCLAGSRRRQLRASPSRVRPSRSTSAWLVATGARVAAFDTAVGFTVQADAACPRTWPFASAADRRSSARLRRRRAAAAGRSPP